MLRGTKFFAFSTEMPNCYVAESRPRVPQILHARAAIGHGTKREHAKLRVGLAVGATSAPSRVAYVSCGPGEPAAKLTTTPLAGLG
jgi:hypothetical protein